MDKISLIYINKEFQQYDALSRKRLILIVMQTWSSLNPYTICSKTSIGGLINMNNVVCCQVEIYVKTIQSFIIRRNVVYKVLRSIH